MKIINLFFSAIVTLTSVSALAGNLVEFVLAPQSPVSSDAISVFMHANTTFQTPGVTNIILKAKMDGSDVSLLHPTENMWILALPPFNYGSTHAITADYYLEDKVLADGLRSEIANLDGEISSLESQLLIEQDEDQRVILQAELSSKTASRLSALSELEGAQTLVGTDNYSFTVNW